MFALIPFRYFDAPSLVSLVVISVDTPCSFGKNVHLPMISWDAVKMSIKSGLI